MVEENWLNVLPIVCDDVIVIDDVEFGIELLCCIVTTEFVVLGMELVFCCVVEVVTIVTGIKVLTCCDVVVAAVELGILFVELIFGVLSIIVELFENGVVETHVRFGSEIVKLPFDVMFTLEFAKMTQPLERGSIRLRYVAWSDMFSVMIMF